MRANLTDRVEYDGLSFRFDVVRVWEQPAELFLTAGVGLLPISVLARPPAGMTREQALPDQVRRMAERAEAEATGEEAELLMSAYLLAGMHLPRERARAIVTRVLEMRESDTYLGILEEGAVSHQRETLLKLGRAKLGTPTAEQTNRVNAIQDLARLDRLVLRVLKVNTWDELLRGW